MDKGELQQILSALSGLDDKTHALIQRLDQIESKVQEFLYFREKFLDWMAQYSRKLEEAREFKDESRLSFESVFCKLEDLDQDVRLLKAAVRDVDRRYETAQKQQQSQRPLEAPKTTGS